METRFGIIADDLTGALDAAGAFASSGLTVSVQVSPNAQIEADGRADVMCVNTQTRHATDFAVATAIEEGWKRLQRSGSERLYLKIDSTLRGNVAISCGSALAASAGSALIVCPAFPSMGRTVSDGKVFVHGHPLEDSAEGHDAFAGPTSSSILEVLDEHREISPISVPTTDLEDNSVVNRLIQDGYNAIVVDADSDEDIDRIAQRVIAHHGLVPVGSAGLAYAIGRSVSSGSNQTPAPEVESGSHPLVICGSINPVSHRQVEIAHSKGAAKIVRLDSEVASGPWREARAYAGSVLADLTTQIGNCPTILSWPVPSDMTGVSTKKGKSLAAFAGSLAYGLASRVEDMYLIIIGGETAYGVLSALGATNLAVTGELLRGVPMSRVLTGVASGTDLVTKAGGFGDENTLLEILSQIE